VAWRMEPSTGEAAGLELAPARGGEPPPRPGALVGAGVVSAAVHRPLRPRMDVAAWGLGGPAARDRAGAPWGHRLRDSSAQQRIVLQADALGGGRGGCG